MMFPSIVFAKVNNPALGNLGANINGVDFMGKFLSSMIAVGMVVAAVLFIFLLIIGGIKWITAGGDKAQAESARKTITNALIGIIVIFSLYAIVNLVSCFFGLSFLQINIGTLNVSLGACPGGT